MSHVRTQVRLAVADALRARQEFNDKVFPNLRGQLGRDQLPAAVIRTPSETSENQANTSKERQITVLVELIGGGQMPPDEVDALCVAAELALDASTLGGLVTTIELTDTEIDFTRDDLIEIGSALLTFSAVLFTDIGDPETST